MSKGSRSRVKDKKQFDATFDSIQKKDKESNAKSTKFIKKTDHGRATRYYY